MKFTDFDNNTEPNVKSTNWDNDVEPDDQIHKLWQYQVEYEIHQRKCGIPVIWPVVKSTSNLLNGKFVQI